MSDFTLGFLLGFLGYFITTALVMTIWFIIDTRK